MDRGRAFVWKEERDEAVEGRTWKGVRMKAVESIKGDDTCRHFIGEENGGEEE